MRMTPRVLTLADGRHGVALFWCRLFRDMNFHLTFALSSLATYFILILEEIQWIYYYLNYGVDGGKPIHIVGGLNMPIKKPTK